jgi:hypothetical protein
MSTRQGGHFQSDSLGLDLGEGQDRVAGLQRWNALRMGGHARLEQRAGAGQTLGVIGVGVAGDDHFASR